MTHQAKSLGTRHGKIEFPCYIPVTTFGDRYKLDSLIRPYLPLLAPAVLASYYYAQQMQPQDRPAIPLWIDSGGFVGLKANSQIKEQRGLGIIEVQRDDQRELLHPEAVLEFQSEFADVAFTLDLPIPPGLDKAEAIHRQSLTIANALWAKQNCRRRDLPLYAVVQSWDSNSARTCAQAYVNAGFEAVAIGGLVPRLHDLAAVLQIIRAVRAEIGVRPLHIFGLGHPKLLPQLYAAGADSVDSSSYVRTAISGKVWSETNGFDMLDNEIEIAADLSPTERLHLALLNLAIATGKSVPISAFPQLHSFISKL